MMPVFLAASSHSWSVIALLSLLMAVVTVTLMCLLVLAALAGLDRVDLSRWSRAEPAIVGLVLIGLAIHGFLSQ
jgi:threonine/homoserine/homoserine lactone efflux protein